MFVAASSECFPQLSLEGVLQRLVDLEYTNVEIAIHERGNQMKPSAVYADLEKAIALCRDTWRLTVSGYSVDIDAPDDLYYEQFAACCKLAKATKVVTITVPAAELGTPFNAEVERLQQLVSIASGDGVLVGSLFGVAANDFAAGDVVEIQTAGVFDLKKGRRRRGRRAPTSTGTPLRSGALPWPAATSA